MPMWDTEIFSQTRPVWSVALYLLSSPLREISSAKAPPLQHSHLAENCSRHCATLMDTPLQQRRDGMRRRFLTPLSRFRPCQELRTASTDRRDHSRCRCDCRLTQRKARRVRRPQNPQREARRYERDWRRLRWRVPLATRPWPQHRRLRPSRVIRSQRYYSDAWMYVSSSA